MRYVIQPHLGSTPPILRLQAIRCSVVVALLALGLTACAPEQNKAPAAEATSYFPLVAGAHWVYEIDIGVGSTEVEVEARGEMEIDGLEAAVFVMDEHNLGESFGMVERAPIAYLSREGYFSRITALDYDADGRIRRLGHEEPNWFLPILPEPGQLWTQATRVFNLPDGGGGGDIRWEGRVLSRGTLSVPAGDFDDVLVIRMEYWDPRASELGPLVTYEDSYARGVGLIQSVTRNELDGSGILEQRLLRYDFPAQ